MGFFSSKKDKQILYLNTVIEELTKKLNMAEMDNITLNNKISKLIDSNIDYENTIKEKDVFISSLNTKIEELKVDNVAKDLKTSNLLNDINTLTDELSELKSDKTKDECIDNLYTTITIKDNRINELESIVSNLEKDIVSLNTDLISLYSINRESKSDRGIDDAIKINLNNDIDVYLTKLTVDNVLHSFMFFICNVLREPDSAIELREDISDLIMVYKSILINLDSYYLHPTRVNTLIIDKGYIPVDSVLFNKYTEFHSSNYSLCDIDNLISVIDDNIDIVFVYYKSKKRLNSLPYLRSEAYYTDEDFEEMNKFYNDLYGTDKESNIIHKEDTLNITTINLSNAEYIDTSLVPIKVKIHDNSIEVSSWLEAYCCICTYLNLCSASKSLDDLSNKPIWSNKGVDIVLLSEDKDSLSSSIVKPFDVGNGLYLSYPSDKVEDILSILLLLSNYIKETSNIDLCFNSN